MATGDPPRTRPLRADAARNRDKLLAAASAVFAERGLDAPLEEIARRAGVSIGTLYNHFPTRQSFCAALFPDRIADLDRIAAGALADPDPWRGFVTFAEGLFALQAESRALNDLLASSFPGGADLDACGRGGALGALVERAKASGALRADFEFQDLATMVWAMSQVIRESMDVAPQAWRRFLAFFLDGLRADAAHAVRVPALTPDELDEIVRRSAARG
ncbi:TetR/AcrR family transcriptional regulator [Actinomadura sp. WMMB 499]|uniref:TetR/AcrR family transcriptional regulator n=1 Tax=Actinomadura sp. WMMB 499 TaxID=1219491 RepID=UPI0012484EFB|nr:TetR/AcrR family transcriptional regulator [Actinomadura sp. WMMB 499]QFG23402.1 helix-turn-helix transcriptional regulator [Actinomadura sp. WMMB 499]